MAQEEVITLTQFKTVIEGIRSDFKKLYEHMDHNFEIIKEDIRGLKSGVQGLKMDVLVLKNDVQGLKTDVKELKTDVQVLKTDVKELKTDVQVLKTDVKGLKTDVKELKADVQVIKADVHTLKADSKRHSEQLVLLHEGQMEMKAMLSKKVDRDEFNRLEKRVGRLERKTA